MTLSGVRYSYGPVPSRRLGRSLGINNIPAKVCSYSCIYCQVGRTTRIRSDRRFFYDPNDVFRDVKSKLAKATEVGERVDYLAFVPDGEPTLDVNLGRESMLLKTLAVPVAAITNSSLLWRDDVREDLSRADWVSLKIDAVREPIWRRINRPHKAIRLSQVLDGMLAFAKTFAEFLEAHPKVSRLAYPGLPGHPGHDVAARQMHRGFGALLAFNVGKDEEDAKRFVAALKTVFHAVSLGSTESLICIPYLTTMLYLPPERRTTFGLEKHTVRLSVGIEPPDKLVADLKQALACVA
ncbi:PLP-dependent transferase [Candidatus Sumerlaeota bacterium]|nr:PLP-dependent transferase [Candidatus Sumerlaeota bacterium]